MKLCNVGIATFAGLQFVQKLLTEIQLQLLR